MKKTDTAGPVYYDIKDHYLAEQRFTTITEGLRKRYHNLFIKMLRENAIAIADFITNMNTEINLSLNHKVSFIEVLSALSHFNGNKKAFREMNRENILSFLDSVRKPEITDPQHKWVGTYNLYRVLIVKFFKWLYYPDMHPAKRQKPSFVENIPKLKRKERSIYKPSDLWTGEHDLLFLKYCPSKRMKCYHAVSRDLSCRPHELLRLKIKDVFFKSTGGYQYAEVLLNGKTGSRSIPLINSIPYLKDYLDNEHPQPSNPNAPLNSDGGDTGGDGDGGDTGGDGDGGDTGGDILFVYTNQPGDQDEDKPSKILETGRILDSYCSTGGAVWRTFSNGVFSGRQGPAYEPWKDWKTELEEGEGPLSLVASAILAANAHNTQPWLFVVNPNRIDLNGLAMQSS